MRRLSPAAVLVLVAFSVPVAIELRTVAGFFGIDLPLVAVVVFEAVVLGIIFVLYTLGQVQGDEEESAT
jgi:hypothetical protein